jgi:hypothetical protein
MTTFDLPRDIVEFLCTADWECDVKYCGAPLTISVDPPGGISDGEELEFFRALTAKAVRAIPEVISGAAQRFYPELHKVWQPGTSLSFDDFRGSLRPRLIFITAKECCIELDDREGLFGDHAIVGRIDVNGVLIGIELEG